MHEDELLKKESQLAARLERITEMEAQILKKEKALNLIRFRAFGAARQIRTADLILTKKVGGPRPPTSPRFCVESQGIFSFSPDCGRFL